MSITGALPSMLACNASPTWCAIFNRAEALAQANLMFTFDSCKILDAANNFSNTQNEPLRACVQKETSNGLANNQALDKCSIGDNSDDNVSKQDRAANATAQSGKTFKEGDLFKKLCKEKESPKYASSNKAYSISSVSCEMVAEIFPGIEVSGGFLVAHGGTFSDSPGEKIYEDRINKSSGFLVDLLVMMHKVRYGLGPYRSEGAQPRHKVVKHKDVLSMLGYDSKNRLKGICYEDAPPSCKNDVTKLPPVYKFSPVGGLPSLMVSPETLFEIIEVIPNNLDVKETFDNPDSRLSLALEPLVLSLSFTHAQDILKDLSNKLIETCKKDQDMQGSVAQLNCNANIEKNKQQLENLKTRNYEDKNHLMAQAQFYQEVEKIRSTRINIRQETTKQGKDQLKDPRDL